MRSTPTSLSTPGIKFLLEVGCGMLGWLPTQVHKGGDQATPDDIGFGSNGVDSGRCGLGLVK